MARGQAAMNFLLEYGWAILVILAAIGALAYFGILKPPHVASPVNATAPACSRWSCTFVSVNTFCPGMSCERTVITGVTRANESCEEAFGSTRPFIDKYCMVTG